MSETTDEHQVIQSLDLRDPVVAGVLAWLVPGAGHLYQRRYLKAVIFFVCIVSTFVYGLALGSVPSEGWYGRTVYYSFRPGDRRLHYIAQLGAGLIAMPAVVQVHRMASGKQVLFGGLMAPPRSRVPRGRAAQANADEPTAHQLKRAMPKRFELGTLYTLVAGLLNVLAIYDACAGPVLTEPRRRKKDQSSEGSDEEESAGGDSTDTASEAGAAKSTASDGSDRSREDQASGGDGETSSSEIKPDGDEAKKA